MTIGEAYEAALSACRRARQQGKKYVALQRCKDGGFRLAAVSNSYEGPSSYDFGGYLVGWAINLLYRLADEHLADFDYADIDAFVDELEAAG